MSLSGHQWGRWVRLNPPQPTRMQQPSGGGITAEANLRPFEARAPSRNYASSFLRFSRGFRASRTRSLVHAAFGGMFHDQRPADPRTWADGNGERLADLRCPLRRRDRV